MNQDFYWLDDNSAEQQKAQEKADTKEIQELKYLAKKCGIEF